MPMSSNASKSEGPTLRRGDKLIVLAGLPRDTLEWTKRTLEADKSQKRARYVGAPSTPNDWRHLYGRANIAELLTLIERESRLCPPHRIILLYVPSRDVGNLMSALEFVCFLAPLELRVSDRSDNRSRIEWRHKKSIAWHVVCQALHRALRATNALKSEITDRRISPFTLPARNFHYPDRGSTISDTYRSFAQHRLGIADIRAKLSPSRFTRDQLPGKAFRGQQHTDLFFQDSRGRVFPPDAYHGRVRVIDEEDFPSTLSLALRQRYRFGVTVRDGILHYDMQYEVPRQLKNEPMYCAKDGTVSVTGSHANVGVNDVVWVPRGWKRVRRK